MNGLHVPLGYNITYMYYKKKVKVEMYYYSTSKANKSA